MIAYHNKSRFNGLACLLLLLVLCLLTAKPALSAAVEISNRDFHYRITQNVSYFEDKNNIYDAQDFLDPTLQQQFTPARTPVMRMGYTESTVWLRLQIDSHLDTPSFAILFVNSPNLGVFNSYQYRDGTIVPLESTGNLTDNIHGLVRNKAPTLSLLLSPNQTNEYLIEIRTQQYMTFTLQLASPSAYYERQFEQTMILGVLIGTLFILGLYGLIGFFRNFDKVHLSYSNYAFTIMLYILCSHGFIGYYWFASPGLQPRLEATALLLLSISWLYHTRTLLDLPKTRRHLDSLLKIAIAISLAILIISFFISINLSFRIATFLSLVALPLSAYATALRAADGCPEARLMIVPKAVLLLVGGLTAQAVYGMLAFEVETIWWLQSALLFEVIIGLFALSARSRKVQILSLKKQQGELIKSAERRAKTEFFSQLSHEIRTPMNGILGMAELLEDSPLNDSQEDYVKTITASGNNLLKILDDILDYSKIETGKMTLDIASFDIAMMLNECIEQFNQRACEKNIELITYIQGDVPFQVKGDPTRVRQVLANLISNSIKFTDQGEVIIEISRDTERSPNHIRFQVSDTGTGMARDRLQEIFSHDQDHIQNLGHHGLGLPISRQLVKMMEGEIDAQSQPNRGSSFWFSIPLEPDPDGQDTPLIADQLNGLRLLVVDDNASCRLVIQQQASSWGMLVSTAVNGKQALALLHNQATIHEPFDIVLLDHEMPGMSGLELAARIKEDGVINNDPLVLMLTGLGLAPSNTAARNAGIRRVISKPVTGRVLKTTLLEELAHLRRIQGSNPVDLVHKGALPPLKVLVAEDHHLSQKVVRGMLSRLGVTATTVDNGKDALQQVQSQSFDIVLMDCEMPYMDGFEATRKIREWETQTHRQPIPIIALTAHIMDEHKERSLKSGMNDYLSKPIELNELRNILSIWSAKQETIPQEPASNF